MRWGITASSLVLTLALVVLPVMGAASNCVVPSSNIVSWWTGDTNESDLYRVNNPSKVNAVSIVPAEVSNGFLYAPGAYIDIPASKSLANQRFTLAAWVRPDGPGPNNDQYGSIIIQQDIDEQSVAASLYWRAAPDERFVFVFGNSSTEVLFSNDIFPAGQFYFVSGTYDVNTFRLYVNGVLEGSFSETKRIAYSNRTWEIGSSDAISRGVGYPRTWNGIIDEVQVYNVPLPVASIAAIFKAGSAGDCKGSVVVTPTSETFAPQTVGTTSAPRTIVILNNRDAAITMDPFTITGSDIEDFAKSSSTCGSTLAGRRRCSVDVTFTPKAIGKREATLNVNDSALGSPQRVSLTGTGK